MKSWTKTERKRWQSSLISLDKRPFKKKRNYFIYFIILKICFLNSLQGAIFLTWNFTENLQERIFRINEGKGKSNSKNTYDETSMNLNVVYYDSHQHNTCCVMFFWTKRSILLCLSVHSHIPWYLPIISSFFRVTPKRNIRNIDETFSRKNGV